MVPASARDWRLSGTVLRGGAAVVQRTNLPSARGGMHGVGHRCCGCNPPVSENLRPRGCARRAGYDASRRSQQPWASGGRWRVIYHDRQRDGLGIHTRMDRTAPWPHHLRSGTQNPAAGRHRVRAPSGAGEGVEVPLDACHSFGHGCQRGKWRNRHTCEIAHRNGEAAWRGGSSARTSHCRHD